jgi:hypothetical protein
MGAVLHKFTLDSPCVSSVIAERHEQTDTRHLQDDELASL